MKIIVEKRRAAVVDFRLGKHLRYSPQLYYTIDREKLVLYFPLLLADVASGDYVSAHEFREYLVRPKGRLAQLMEVGVVLESMYRVANSTLAKLEEGVDQRGIYIEFFDPRVDLARNKKVYDYMYKI